METKNIESEWIDYILDIFEEYPGFDNWWSSLDWEDQGAIVDDLDSLIDEMFGEDDSELEDVVE